MSNISTLQLASMLNIEEVGLLAEFGIESSPQMDTRQVVRILMSLSNQGYPPANWLIESALGKMFEADNPHEIVREFLG